MGVRCAAGAAARGCGAPGVVRVDYWQQRIYNIDLFFFLLISNFA
ncbi:hypothetical protein ASZ90_010867 [hydrocarbon metagenome]|uniref:Uncharacterized protein n=1 Tax=hydrocarbon metagenome TaxID=938273 RepID=A0A0W8FFC0_9ZZZZ